VQFEKLDHEYLREWALKLDIEIEMEKLKNEATIE
jgi:hypothetical protein